MARRRVNTKFLIILTVAVIGVGLAGLIVHRLRRGDPAKYVEAARTLVEQKNYEEAAKNYARAVSIESRQPAVWVAYGDTLTQLVHQDPENGQRAFRAWQQATELDPNNKEALSRMLGVFLAETENRGAASSIDRGREVAARLAKIDPADVAAAYAGPLLTVRASMYGIQTSHEPFAEAVQQLADLSAKHPKNADLTGHATGAKFALAQSVAKTQPAHVRKLFEEAGTIMAASLKAAPDDPSMQFHAVQVFSALAQVATTAEARQQHADAAKAALAEATKLAKPDDERYASIQMANAMFAMRERDRARAEQIVRDLLAAKPHDLGVRLQVAGFLADDPAKRAEAIEILERPLEPQTVDVSRFHQVGRSEPQRLLMLANLRLDEYAATNDAAKRKEMHPAIEDAISKLISRLPGAADHPLALQVRGKYQRAQGEHVAAIQTLNKAMTLLEQESQRDATYFDTIELLAMSYMDTQQTGPAKELFGRLVAQRQTDVKSRLALTQLLLRERNVEAARPHLDVLEKLLPEHPSVIKLRLASLDRVKDADQVRALFARLPEKTRAEVVEKATAAAQLLGDAAEAERLLTAFLGENPADPEVSVLLARTLAAQDQRDRANTLIAEAIKAHPDHKLLQLTQKQLANASPEEMRQWRMDVIGDITDPTQKALQLAEMAAREGKSDEALKQLQEAERTSPENMRVKESLFAQHVARRQWDEAGRYLELLARANQDQAGGLLYRVKLALAKAQAAATPADRQAEVDRALKYGQELTQRLPEFGQSWQNYGMALQAAGRPQEATERYATALEKQPDNLEAMRGMIDCYYALNRPADVKRYIDMGLRLNPNNGYFIEQQTNYELAYGDPSNALPQREAMLKKNPDNAQAWRAAAQAYLAAYHHQAGRQNEAGAKEMLSKAADTLKQAIAKFPDDRWFYGAFVDVAWAMKDPAAAEATIKQLATRDAWKDKPEPQVMMADFLARSGKVDEAESMMRSIVAKHPTDVNVQLGLVSLLAQRGKVDDALAALQPNETDPRVRGQLVEIQIRSGKLEDADQTIQAALAADPRSVRYQALAGYVSMGRGRWEEADARLQAALRMDGRDPFALYYHGLLRLNQPQPNIDEAVQRLTAARDAQPEVNLLGDIRLALGEALRLRKDFEGAARELELALQAQPTNSRVRMSLINIYLTPAVPRYVDAERTIHAGLELFKDNPDLLYAEARMWLARKDTPKALAAARRAVAAAPKNEQLQSQLLAMLIDARDYPAALKEADQMIAANQERWWAFMFRAVAKRYSSDKDGALQDFETALTLTSDQGNEGAAQEVIARLAREIGIDEALARILPRADAEPRWRLVAAQLYLSKGSFDRAEDMIERVLEDEKLTPAARATALGFAGNLYLSFRPQPQGDKAYAAYLKLLDMKPDDMGALNNMACLLAETVSPPRPQDAMQYSQRAYDLMLSGGARQPLIMDTHGWVLTLNGRAEDGIDILQQAAKLWQQQMAQQKDGREFPEVHYHLGEAYLKTAAPEEAQKQFELAAEGVRKAEEKKQDVDPPFRAKVDAALARAKELVRTKSANAAP